MVKHAMRALLILLREQPDVSRMTESQMMFDKRAWRWHFILQLIFNYGLSLSFVSAVVHHQGGGGGSGTDRELPDEQNLLQKLLINYNPAVRPVFNASAQVTVKFGFALILITDMDEVNQVLTTNVWLEQEWVDERLHWNPDDYNGLTVLRIPCKKVWLPDIVLYNSADDFTSGYMQSKAMVNANGTVFWPPPAKLRSTCKIDITFFPFDDQRCTMKFGSWTYDGFQVNLTKKRDKVDVSNYVHSGEWDLLRVDVQRNEIKYTCCPEVYPDITFTIVMRRRTLYYLFNIIFPCLWLTVLSLLGFWLPPDSGEKITLGITVLLAFSVFMLLIAENMPATSEFVPLIGIYLTVIMATTSLSIVLTVFVLHLHHIGPNHKAVSSSVKQFMFNRVAPFFRMDTVDRYQKRLRRHQRQGLYDRSVENQRLIKSAFHSSAVDFNGTVALLPMDVLESSKTSRNHSTISRNVASDIEVESRRQGGYSIKRQISSSIATAAVASFSADDHYDHIKAHLANLIRRQEEEEDAQETLNDWRMMAYIIDRLLFWLFLLAATSSTITILMILPLFKTPEEKVVDV